MPRPTAAAPRKIAAKKPATRHSSRTKKSVAADAGSDES
jgi:hypothetical protein